MNVGTFISVICCFPLEGNRDECYTIQKIVRERLWRDMKKIDPQKAADRVYQTTVRVPPHLRDKIEASAARAGRSFSAELQVRLERSVLDDEREPLRNDPMIRMMAAAVDLAQRQTGRSWWDHGRTADSCREAFQRLLLMMPTREGLGSAESLLDVNTIAKNAIENETKVLDQRNDLAAKLRSQGNSD